MASQYARDLISSLLQSNYDASIITQLDEKIVLRRFAAVSLSVSFLTVDRAYSEEKKNETGKKSKGNYYNCAYELNKNWLVRTPAPAVEVTTT